MGDFSIFATRLKELRTSLKLTQREFAKQVGCTAATLSSYENGSKSPSLEIVKNIAEVYSVSLDWLCGLNNGEKENQSISTYSDVLRIFFLLDSYKDLNLKFGLHIPEVSGYDSITLNNVIQIRDSTLTVILEDWSKMKDLLLEQSIDIEVYDLWVEKTLRKYDVPIVNNNLS